MRHQMPLPHVIVGKTDHHELMVLAMVGAGYPDAADDLLFKLERALITPEINLAEDIVRMGSIVKFWADSGKVREVSLVYPTNADISRGRVSILTPVGTALIGLRAGEATTWEGRDGREHSLRVMSVRQPQLDRSPPDWRGGNLASSALRSARMVEETNDA